MDIYKPSVGITSCNNFQRIAQIQRFTTDSFVTHYLFDDTYVFSCISFVKKQNSVNPIFWILICKFFSFFNFLNDVTTFDSPMDLKCKVYLTA